MNPLFPFQINKGWRTLLSGFAIPGFALVLLSLNQPVVAQDAAGPKTVLLELYELNGDALLYKAERTFTQAEGKITESTAFTDPAGNPVQTVVGVFEEASLAPVSYTVDDHRSGQKETALREEDKVHMTALEKTGDKEKSGTVKYKEGMLIISAITPFIQRNWETLQSGQEMTFFLLAPVKQDYFQFRVVKDDGKKIGVQAPEGGLVVRMEADTWLIRKLVDPLFFVLDGASSHNLLEFRGRSSVKTDAGKDQKLRYVFKTP